MALPAYTPIVPINVQPAPCSTSRGLPETAADHEANGLRARSSNFRAMLDRLAHEFDRTIEKLAALQEENNMLHAADGQSQSQKAPTRFGEESGKALVDGSSDSQLPGRPVTLASPATHKEGSSVHSTFTGSIRHHETFIAIQEWTTSNPKDDSTAAYEHDYHDHVARTEVKDNAETDHVDMWHRVSYPSSPARLAWDFAGGAMVMYDLIWIPMSVVFVPPETPFLVFVDWLAMVYWTINVPMSLTVGFVQDGQLILEPAKIAINYLKTWFIIDMAVVVPDWGFAIANNGSDTDSSRKFLRVLRLVRMVRLVRLAKLKKVLYQLNELIDSEYISIIANIVKMIVLLLVINHYIACLWFVVGNTREADNWIDHHKFRDVTWNYQYTTSFHWSITQFTPSSMHVQPWSIGERIFAIAVVVFALVGFSYVVGSITGSLTQLRLMQEDAAKQFWTLRRYLKQHNVSTGLSTRIRRYIEHAYSKQKFRMSEKSVKLFALLSEQLYAELQSDITLPQLSIHPLFNYMRLFCKVTANRLALDAIKKKFLASGDTLFIQGETATHMAFVGSGSANYQQNRTNFQSVDEGQDWIAEPTLWLVKWTHLGELTAETEADLLLITPKDFGSVVRKNPVARKLCFTYVKNFIAWLNDGLPETFSDIRSGDDSICLDVKTMMELPEAERDFDKGSMKQRHRRRQAGAQIRKTAAA